MSFWGEGVEGTVALEIKYIGAYGCASTSENYNYNEALASASMEVVTTSLPSSSSSNLTMLQMVTLSTIFVFGLGFIAARRSRKVLSLPSFWQGYEEVDVAETSLARGTYRV